MTEFSLATQAVLYAFRSSHTGPGCLAAALRAAIDEVVPEYREHHPETLDERYRKVSAFEVRHCFHFIAEQLENQ